MVNNLTWGPSVAPNMHITLTTPAGQPSQGPTAPAGEVSTRVLSQPPAETKPIGRKQLPEDLFTSIYPLAATPFPGWQRPPHPGMGYSMQYPVGGVMQTYSQPPQSTNPFDLVNEPSLPHASSFPSMASLQGGVTQHDWECTFIGKSASSSSSNTMDASTTTSYPLPSSQSPYLLQHGMTNTAPQAPSHSFPLVNHGVGFGGAGAAFGATVMEQLSSARHSQPGTPSSFAGGNPFG
ncbi:hypothetical protein J5N97_002010 [Dioscorea zingiberensis]|uniref:Uncharacterized protein n=1 Tax=Dioscorea zingiberensis TaxID=325984 RepID=A0A9D5BVL2_9LILI|nr:hypothetical protein J5N97_002010 [Dioscorea zingiberensis]